MVSVPGPFHGPNLLDSVGDEFIFVEGEFLNLWRPGPEATGYWQQIGVEGDQFALSISHHCETRTLSPSDHGEPKPTVDLPSHRTAAYSLIYQADALLDRTRFAHEVDTM